MTSSWDVPTCRLFTGFLVYWQDTVIGRRTDFRVVSEGKVVIKVVNLPINFPVCAVEFSAHASLSRAIFTDAEIA